MIKKCVLTCHFLISSEEELMLVRSIAFRQRLPSVIRSIKQKEKNVIRPIVHIEDSGQIEDINIDNKEIDKTDVCVDEYGTLKYSIE